MEFLLIATAHFLALLSPGPDFFLIMQAALRLPFRYGFAICAGIASANAVYLLCALLGLEAIREMTWLMTTLRYVGALYLIFIGVMLLKAPRQAIEGKTPQNFLQEPHLGRQFMIGFMSGILNPKNAIFYLSLFTVMVSDQTGLTTRWLYALWMTAVVFVWDCGVVIVIGRDQVTAWLGRGVYYLEKVSGAVLALFGLLLPFT